jgi:hypothetical protein
MNKRNTTIALLILVGLILLLFAKTCRFNSTIHEMPDNFPDNFKVDVNVRVDSMFSDSLGEANYPIVIHYQKARRFGKTYAKNHLLSQELSTMTAKPQELDSTEAIHIYTKNIRSKTKFIYLGMYSKSSISEDVEYMATYPVNDSLGFRVVTDSGLVCTVMHWKMYGPSTPGKFRKQAEDRMTKQVEDDLVKDILKKMKRTEDSE